MDDEALTRQLEDAIAVATVAHYEQRRKGGMPYIVHPIGVMMRMHPDKMMMAAAILHDVVEDTELTVKALGVLGMSKEVCDLVDALTKRDGEDYFEEYLPRLVQTPGAVTLKLADAADNYGSATAITDPEEAARKREKYARAIEYLKGFVNA